MKTILGGFGLAAVFVLALVGSVKVKHALGNGAVLIVAMSFSAAWVATEESREMARKVGRALGRARLSLKEAAYLAGMDVAHLCRQLRGFEQMSLSRFASWVGRKGSDASELDPTWEIAFAMELSEGYGLFIRNADLAEIVVTLRPLVDREVRAS